MKIDNYSSKLINSYTILFVVLSIFIFISTIYGVFHFYSSVPYTHDEWQSYIPFYTDTVIGNNWHKWFEEHNEHRIIFSRILFWIGFKFFHGSLMIQILFLFVIHIISTSTIAYIIFKIKSLSLSQRIILVSISISFLFSWIQNEIFNWGFETQVVAVYCFALLSFLTFYLYVINNKNRHFVLTLLFAFMGSICFSNGIFIWIILIFFSFLTPISKVSRSILIFSGLIIVGVFLFTFTNTDLSSNKKSILFNFSQLYSIIEYALWFFSAPFNVIREFLYNHYHYVPFFFRIIVIMIGSFILLSPFYFFFIDFKNKRILEEYNLLFYSISFFVIITAFITAIGRFKFGLDQAMNSRYSTPVYFLWVCIVVLYFKYFFRNKIIIIPIFILIVYIASAQKIIFQKSDKQFNQFALLSLLMNTHANNFNSWNFPQELFNKLNISPLVDDKISCFGTSWVSEVWLNKKSVSLPINKHIVDMKGYINEFDSTNNNNYRYVSGVINNENANTTLTDLITFVDTENKVIGYSIYGTRYQDSFNGFKGYININSDTTVVGYFLGDHPVRVKFVVKLH